MPAIMAAHLAISVDRIKLIVGKYEEKEKKERKKKKKKRNRSCPSLNASPVPFLPLFQSSPRKLKIKSNRINHESLIVASRIPATRLEV
jgi:hypothetical protein